MKKPWPFVLGIIIGFLALAAWRFAAYQTVGVHYHANFAVYINAEREAFAAPTYYEETAGCAIGEKTSPIERTHMHNGENDLVHVHASAVTWGQFFENLGWGIGPEYLRTRAKLFLADNKHPLTYWLNGEPVENPTNLVIGSEDKLLVSYGTTDESQIQTQLASMAGTARAKNAAPDPAGCGGGDRPTWQERLDNIIK